MKIPIVSLVLFFIGYISGVANGNMDVKQPVLRLAIEIGAERENYEFASISGLAIFNKEIFVVDSKAYTIYKYDWNGDFLKKIGQKGKGPGDFSDPYSIQIKGDKLYIYDHWNFRIAITDPEFKTWDYIKTIGLKTSSGTLYSFSFLLSPIWLENDRWLGMNQLYVPEQGKLFFFDSRQHVSQDFFPQLPADIGHLKNAKHFRIATHILAAVNENTRRIMTVFGFPGDTLKITLFDFNGCQTAQTSFLLGKKFQFPYDLMTELFQYEGVMNWVFEIFPFQDYFIVYIAEFYRKSLKADDELRNQYHLIVDSRGKVQYKIPAPYRFRNSSPDGCLIGFREKNDLLTVGVYQLHLPGK